MPKILALGGVTVDLNFSVSNQDLIQLGVEVGTCRQVEFAELAQIREKLLRTFGSLPKAASGGSLANSLSLMARAKIDCGLVGVGGKDFYGELFIAECEQAGLKYLSRLEENMQTGCNLCFSDAAGTASAIWNVGANDLLSPEMLQQVDFASANLVLLEGYALNFGRSGEASVMQAAKTAMQLAKPYVVTLSSVESIERKHAAFIDLVKDAKLVAGNLSQAAALAQVDPRENLELITNKLSKLCSDYIVTLGEEGVVAQIEGQVFQIEATKVPVVDTTGAGDAFLGGYLSAKELGFKSLRALKAGSAFAALVVQQRGARLPSSCDPLKLLNSIEACRD